VDTPQDVQQIMKGGTMTQIQAVRLEKDLKDIATIHKSIRMQRISPSDVVEACLLRIERLNPKINAFITVLADQALEQAAIAEAEISAGKWRGPLHGIPVGIKDFYDTAGIKTTAGFDQFKDRVPLKDATGVAKLKGAGAIIIGKMNMHRLGMGTTGLDSYFGPVRNPWDVDHIPGGSSAGSAAAVASLMCYATLDTDAIGSCRLPAACCGVVGFKGTYGLIDPKGILEGEADPGEMIRWFSHPGITTRAVEDTALVLDVLAEKSAVTTIQYCDELARPGPVRVGVATNFRADREVSGAFETAVEIIRGLGCPMSTITVPFRDPGGVLGNIEAERKGISSQTFRDIDVILLPTTITAVPKVRGAGDDPQALSAANTAFANYYGLPAISVPCGIDKNGLPLGLQIVGKPWSENTVLQLAYRYEKATPWKTKHPDL
jgi:aspartyl-tRNA(Asn)/glutamyl-tRNA(Gln) amidotransferase subunit A